MRKLCAIAIGFTFVAFNAFADEKSEHLEHLRMMMKEMSSHGAVIPQPENINPEATRMISITSRSFSFSPSQFSVNQGDVVTITVSTPANDPSSVGHGILMDTYIPSGIDSPRGGSGTKTFTATTPGTFAFVCTQPSCGSGHTSMIGQMVVNAVSNPAPTVSSVTPNTGPPGGGTAVVITGSNFQTTGTTTVKFDTSLATNVNVSNSTTINAVTPPHSEQTVGVTVTNPDGQTGTLPQAFTYAVPGVRVSSVSPNTGSTAGGTSITITGSGFIGGAAVTIGGVSATNVNVASSTSIVVTTPLGPANEQAAQPQDIVVTNPDGSSGTLARGFTYFVPVLSVTSVSPAVGLTSGGPVVAITGTGFTTTLLSSVNFGGVSATNVTVFNAVTLLATTPAHAVGAVDVAVTVGGSSVTKPSAFTYQTAVPRHRAVRH